MADTKPEVDGGTYAKKRAATRKSAMLRIAKVVCEAGEYVCLIRDLSELGIGLSFLHEAPPEPRIILQTTNGLTYPLERVWAGKRQAGYRFGSEISLNDFLHEESPYENRPIRLEIAAQARITDGRTITRVRLLDISREGAKFESEGLHPQDRLVSFEALGLPQRLGQVRWQTGTQFGMQFQHPLTIEELAVTAIRLQPFDPRLPDRLAGALENSRAA
ncbi:PilZ domain-containing protein [Erythrobacter sp. JK5]|uniref:PilZ domain-containing protein n=1 Tax=Erythrobacter sp. JK5 TaxID=2829500 RepID=UPI001BA9D61B|nr:PilZ domain-containing protein [Erythrobacter sp. JK5]QUL37131.1 PilZ domain-containing protein [Erythrobacter sp. JK5]